jgi:sugar lactone lactonase YvrE
MRLLSRGKLLLFASGMGLALPFAAMAQKSSIIPLEVVKTFDDFRLVGITVSKDGRVFASAPAAQTGNKLIEVKKDGSIAPFPDASWNVSNPANSDNHWVVAQAMTVDSNNHIWVLDTGRGEAPAKVVQFDLATNKMVRLYRFPGVVLPTDSLNDLVVDATRGWAYIANVNNNGSIVVVNLKSGESRHVLRDDRSTRSATDEVLFVNGEAARWANGDTVILHADGIALSDDGDWLYYRPVTDRNYWRVRTEVLRSTMSQAEMSAQVEFLGRSEMSGGISVDSKGRIYGGDLEKSTVVMLTRDPKYGGLHSQVIARDPRLSWADGFAIHDGYLYIADSRLWEVALQNGKPRTGPFGIYRIKMPE